MSLLDDVSIVVTPNGYKAGTLYGVLPTATEGADLVTNGGFDTDSDWNKGTGWTISGGKANSDGTSGSNNLSQSSILLVDKRYKIEITVSNYVSGNVQVSAGAAPRGTMTANGTYTFYQTCTPSTTFYIIANSFDGSVDNVSVKEWTSSDMDVTRATAATRVDENGLVNYAEVLGSDLVINGDFTTNINSWEQYNSVSTWDNGTIKTTSNTTVAWIRQNDILSTGNFYKIIFKAKASNISQNIHIWNGAAFIDTGLSFDSINTYKEFTYYLDFTGSGGQHLILGQHVIGNGDTINFDNVSVKQVDRNNVPRIDYTGGGCPHILAEPQRTNLLPYSSDFSQWITSSVTLTPNATTSPSGSVDSYLVDLSATTDSRLVNNVGVVASTEYTLSFYLKKHESDSNGTFPLAYYDGSNYIKTYVNLTDVWQRFDLTFTNPSGSTFGYGLSRKGTTSDETLTRCYAWGSQLEQASYSTSYIPTSGSAVTRNQDIFTRDGIGSLINDSEGVLFAEWKPKISSDYSFVSINNGTSDEIVTIGKSNNTTSMFVGVRTTSGYQLLYDSSSHDLTIFNKVAVKWKSGDMAVWVNGVEVLTSTSTNTPTGMNKLSFDFSGTNTFPFFGEIRQLQVYKTALTDNQLIQLTGEAGTHFFESYSEMAETLTYTIQ